MFAGQVVQSCLVFGTGFASCREGLGMVLAAAGLGVEEGPEPSSTRRGLGPGTCVITRSQSNVPTASHARNLAICREHAGRHQRPNAGLWLVRTNVILPLLFSQRQATKVTAGSGQDIPDFCTRSAMGRFAADVHPVATHTWLSAPFATES